MTLNFNGVKRLWYGCLISPTLFPTLTGALLGFVIYGISASPWGLLFSLLWCLAWAVLELMIPHGRPRWMVTELTPNFYAVKRLGRRYIFQRRPSQSLTCKEQIHSIVADQRRLPAALTPGRYRTITHMAILRRITRIKNARILSIRPIYTAPMTAIQQRMTGANCKICKQNCILRSFSAEPHTFYIIEFEIKK